MLEPNIRLTHSLLKSIGNLERLAGRWDRLEGGPSGFGEETANSMSLGIAINTLRLDNSCPPTLAARLDTGSFAHDLPEEISSIVKVSHSLFPETVDMLLESYGEFRSGAKSDDPYLRNAVSFFTAPAKLASREEALFPNIQPFLIRNRTAELLSWVNEEIVAGEMSPVLAIGLFHVIFVQISPFPAYNHAYSLVLQGQLLKETGYGFVRYAAPVSYYAENSSQYFAALRQAEKTLGSTWSTVNGWLEFFLKALESSAGRAIAALEEAPDKQRLTIVQRQIVEVVRTNGPATRETIADQTGINLSTVKYNLGVLATRGVLNRLGGGRTTAYTVS